jgi:predicted RNase H-like HicB family nuclease
MRPAYTGLHGWESARRFGVGHVEQYPQARRSEAMRQTFMRYAIVIEKADANFSAYVPDLSGCVATGSTVEETEHAIREAVTFHLDGLRQDGLAIPPSTSVVDYVEVAA